MRDYLEYVRGSALYESRTEAAALAWRTEVVDALEISKFSGRVAAGTNRPPPGASEHGARESAPHDVANARAQHGC